MKLGKILSVIRNVSTCYAEHTYHMGCTVQYEHGVRKYSFNIPSTAQKFIDDSVKNKRVKKLYTRRYHYYYADEFY
jgi:hypothetical protein